MISLALKISFKILTHKINGILGFVRKTFLLAVIGLTISVLSLLMLSSISSGYEASLKDKLSQIESHITIRKWNNQKISSADLKSITVFLDSIKGIDKYSLELEEIAILELEEPYISEGVLIKAFIEPEKSNINQFLINKNEFSIDNDNAIIGESLRKKLNLKIKDKIILLDPNFSNRGGLKYGSKKNKRIEIDGTVQFGLPIIDRSIVYIDKDYFADLFGHSEISNIRIFLKDASMQSDIAGFLESKIGDDFHIKSFNDKHQSNLDSLAKIFDSISIVIYFLLAACCLNISSSIWLIVDSKIKDIHILKLAGMSNVYIYLIFLFITLLSVVASFLCGLLLSVILIYIQNYFQIISVSSDVYVISDLVGVLDFSFLLSLFAKLLFISIVISLFSYLKILLFNNKKIINV